MREAIVGLDIAAYSQTGVMNFVHGADLEISTSTHGTEYLNDQLVLGDILTSGSTLIEATGDVSYQDATTGRDIATLTESSPLLPTCSL